MEEAAAALRERERLLAHEYGLGGPPESLDGEDLESHELADVEFWVDVYTQLVDFTRSLLSAAPEAPVGAGPAADPAGGDLRASMLHAQVQELHLTYWVDQLNRLRGEAGCFHQPPTSTTP